MAQVVRYDSLHWQADPLLADAQDRARALEVRDPQSLSWLELLATVRAAMEIPALAGELRRRYFPGAVFAFRRLRRLGVDPRGLSAHDPTLPFVPRGGFNISLGGEA